MQICGDAHLMNFGFFASPERQLVFDINDFDETHPGPWEWDIKRLAVSLVLAGRSRGFDAPAAREIVLRLAGTYRRRIRAFSQMSQLDLWYCRVGFEQLLSQATDEGMRQQLNKVAGKARNQTQERLLPKMADLEGGGLRLRDNPPVIFHLDDHNSPLAACDDWLGEDSRAKIQRMLDSYIDTLKEDRRELLQRFRLVDAAFKVVGVGSVGTRCLALLLQDDYDQPLFLQLKEARPSVLESFTQPCVHGNQGKRVVFGQRLMQATSDLFLGWTQGADGRHFYMRQLRDMKAARRWRPSPPPKSWPATARPAAGRWRAPTPSPAAARPRSQATWAIPTSSTRCWPTTPRPTPTRWKPTTGCSTRRCAADACQLPRHDVRVRENCDVDICVLN
ncbi:Uncharacterized protein conserved in bacteria [Chromobacterium violaceum]|uniref:Uncharacterized protein conserved in bacteria n=1 Tax=Chromobacterium violaceum TaxID=536 RepID=A0A3S4J5K2_CHRVL|nr:Uncharacterized protein conserved in bacteria [Chromobacterium violaceum]